jgi:hypothetical protein
MSLLQQTHPESRIRRHLQSAGYIAHRISSLNFNQRDMKRTFISMTVLSLIGLFLFSTPALAGEPIPGIDVRASLGGRVIATETTSQSGMVTFTGLTPDAEYTITVDTEELTKLMKAKEKANRTKCSNNLRVIGSKKDYATDPYVETTQRANAKGEITLQLMGECKKP